MCITIVTQQLQNQGHENIVSDIQPLEGLPEIKTILSTRSSRMEGI